MSVETPERDADDQKPTPPVPPAEREVVIPEKRRGSRVLESEFVRFCACGGRVRREKIATGRVVILIWEHERWDPDDYETSTQHEEVEERTSCRRCEMEVVV